MRSSGSFRQNLHIPTKPPGASKLLPSQKTGMSNVVFNSKNTRRFPCMFTKQLQKKRKAWSDGVLRVVFYAGGYHCTLIDCSGVVEKPLEAKQLVPQEVQKLKGKESFEIEMENHLVEILRPVDEEAIQSAYQPPLKLPKFVPPKRCIPPVREEVQIINRNSYSSELVNTATDTADFSRRGPYKVTDTELEDIWGDDSTTKQVPQGTVENISFAARSVDDSSNLLSKSSSIVTKQRSYEQTVAPSVSLMNQDIEGIETASDSRTADNESPVISGDKGIESLDFRTDFSEYNSFETFKRNDGNIEQNSQLSHVENKVHQHHASNIDSEIAHEEQKEIIIHTKRCDKDYERVAIEPTAGGITELLDMGPAIVVDDSIWG